MCKKLRLRKLLDGDFIHMDPGLRRDDDGVSGEVGGKNIGALSPHGCATHIPLHPKGGAKKESRCIHRTIMLLGVAVLYGCAMPQATTGSSKPALASRSELAARSTASLAGANLPPPLSPASAAPVGGGKTIRVGLLLPITGRNADIGRAMQDAATVALYDQYSSLSLQATTIRVELLPKDTGDTPEQAAAAANAAIAEGAEFLIGPIFADATEAVAPIARAKHISVLSLSNNLPHAGQGVYAYGFSPQDQTARVVGYAMKTDGSRIAALVPNSPLGATVLAAAKATLAAQGQVLAAEATYTPQGLGIETAINTLIPPGTAPNFDALLLPEGGPALNTILRTLASHGATAKNIQLLGTGMWDDANLVRRVPLEGAWLASSPPDHTALFENRFRHTYNYLPPRIASLAYDAVALTVTLATSGRPFDAATLTNAAGFSGPANGVFRLTTAGKTERGLAVLQINGASFRVLSAAPVVFAAPH